MRHPLLCLALIAPLSQATPLEIRFTSPPSGKSKGKSENFMGDVASFPSSNWESQAQPVGNGRIGAMVFGNPLKERIQFNDASLWTGGANPSGGYELNEFGAYQNFGDMFIDLAGATSNEPGEPVCASGHEPSGSESVDQAGDGNASSKWSSALMCL